MVEAAGLAALLWAGVSAAMAVLYLVVRFTHKWMRTRRWAAERERIASGWTAR